MTLRICDNGARQVVPASLEAVEQTFASDTSLSQGTEITLADGERWLMAFVVGPRGEPGELFLSGTIGGAWIEPGRVDRSEARRRFRRFLEEA